MFPKIIKYLILSFLLLFPGLVLAGNTTGYAWGENVGWINLNPTHGGITVADSAVTGYAWGENVGWINFNPTHGGVTNDGDGNLSGYAWGENVGWINLNPTHGGVTISSSNGNFSGYGWGENTGWINFGCTDCNSNTSWRVAAVARAATPPTTFADSLVINQGAIETDVREVTLALRASYVVYMEISNNPDFVGSVLELYQTTKSWTLTEGDGEKTVYARFVSPEGANSTIVSDNITLKTAAPAAPPSAEAPVGPSEETPALPEAPPEEIIPEAPPEEIIPPEKPISQMTIEELQAKIAEILAQIEALQVQLVELEKAPSITFEVDLKYGDRGDEVVKLQKFLIEEGFLAGGLNTSWFGPLTKAAVIRFQEKYAKDILGPWGLTKGTGFVGKTTRAKLNKILTP